MLTSAEEVVSWLKKQEEVVLIMGAYLMPVRAYIEKCEQDPDFAEDMNGVYQLGTSVRNLADGRLHTLLITLDLLPYREPFMNYHYAIVRRVTDQTISSRSLPASDYLGMVKDCETHMAEAMLALAKVPPPVFSITLAAGTPFDAYLLISCVVENATDFVYVLDAYSDASLFSRYLFRVKDGVQVSIRTSPSKWSKKGWNAQFEEAEALFRAQHPQYDRQDRDDLHARYLVTETGGWRVDGSIKDMAVSKDCPIHTLLPEEREKVIADYFAKAAE